MQETSPTAPRTKSLVGIVFQSLVLLTGMIVLLQKHDANETSVVQILLTVLSMIGVVLYCFLYVYDLLWRARNLETPHEFEDRHHYTIGLYASVVTLITGIFTWGGPTLVGPYVQGVLAVVFSTGTGALCTTIYFKPVKGQLRTATGDTVEGSSMLEQLSFGRSSFAQKKF